jgi:hypothetical protein
VSTVFIQKPPRVTLKGTLSAILLSGPTVHMIFRNAYFPCVRINDLKHKQLVVGKMTQLKNRDFFFTQVKYGLA